MYADSRIPAVTPRVVSKPKGGFRPITVLQVCMAWWAYRTGFLPRYLDFRVYLALHEVTERRLAASRVRARKGRAGLVPVLARNDLVAEVRGMIGGTSDRLVRAALSRLESVGLVSLKGLPDFPGGFQALVDPPAELINLLSSLSEQRGMSQRRLAVPRPMLRLLARTASPTLAATVLAYLMRCVKWRGNELHVGGCCTAGFVSEWFGVDARSVKRARAELRRMGWLVMMAGSAAERVGEVPNLAWSESPNKEGMRGSASCTDLSPPVVKRSTRMSPPTTCTQLPSGTKNQQRRWQPGSGFPGAGKLDYRPQLSNIQPEDLVNVGRTDLLFEEAARLGLVKRSTAGRLQFHAAAARALRVGSRNPCGLFAAIVRRGLWSFISQIDEDLALKELRVAGGVGLLEMVDTNSRTGDSATGLMSREGGSGSTAGTTQRIVASVLSRWAIRAMADPEPNVRPRSSRATRNGLTKAPELVPLDGGLRLGQSGKCLGG